MDRRRWWAVLAVVDGPPAVADTPEDQAPEPNLAMLKVWAEYAKERFKAADTLIGEYRSWARQLGAAIGVGIRLEGTPPGRLATHRGAALQGGGHSHWRVPELGSPARGSHRRGHRTGGDPPGAPRTRRGVAASSLLARALPRRLLRHARAAVLDTPSTPGCRLQEPAGGWPGKPERTRQLRR